MISRETKILFLRRKDRLDESFITLEIWNEYIYQAHTKFNGSPDDEMKKWIEMYAKKKNLIVHEDAYVNCDI